MKYTYDYKNFGEKSKIEKFVLLSKSPRRKELLAFLNPTIKVNEIDERKIQKKFMNFYKDEDFLHRASKTCCEISIEKSKLKHEKNTMYISADTMVILDDKIYNKPKDKKEAYEMFISYFGKSHYVVTSVCLSMENYLDCFYTIAKIEFVDFYKELEILLEEYIDSMKAMDKAGAYGIQEIDRRFVKSVSGDINTVIGMPVCETSYRIFKK